MAAWWSIDEVVNGSMGGLWGRSGVGVLVWWKSGVLEYLFGPIDVWRSRDAHFIEGGGEE
jgi:hypothetical protein